jgi:hypothetical protein
MLMNQIKYDVTLPILNIEGCAPLWVIVEGVEVIEIVLESIK